MKCIISTQVIQTESCHIKDNLEYSRIHVKSILTHTYMESLSPYPTLLIPISVNKINSKSDFLLLSKCEGQQDQLKVVPIPTYP